MAQKVVDKTITPEDLEKQEKIAKEAEKKAEKPTEEASTNTKTKSRGEKKERSAKYKDVKSKLESGAKYTVEDAVSKLKDIDYANFPGSVEMHINLGIDPRNSDQRVRFTTSLPNGIGKTITPLVIDKDNAEKTIKDIETGALKPGSDFDVVIATPDVMKDLAKVARILGPKGMMPSPKTGTVTSNIDEAKDNLSKGQVEIKTQPGHTVIHQMVGKTDFEEGKIVDNVKFILEELENNRPAKIKGKFIRKAYLATTMSPSLRVVV